MKATGFPDYEADHAKPVGIQPTNREQTELLFLVKLPSTPSERQGQTREGIF